MAKKTFKDNKIENIIIPSKSNPEKKRAEKTMFFDNTFPAQHLFKLKEKGGVNVLNTMAINEFFE